MTAIDLTFRATLSSVARQPSHFMHANDALVQLRRWAVWTMYAPKSELVSAFML
jgi:hypothetical protein